MSKRWLGLTLSSFVVLFMVRTAHADLTAPVSPNNAFTINDSVGSPAGTTQMVNLDADAGTDVTLAYGTTCDGLTSDRDGMTFMVTPSGLDVLFTFTASARGTQTCTVTLTTSQTPDLTLVFTLNGRAPDIDITTTSPVSFGNVRVLDPNVGQQTITIENDGEETLNITGFSFGGSAHFGTSSGTFSITPGGMASFPVTFDPEASGPLMTTLSFETNDPEVTTNPGKAEIMLTGTGTNARLNIAPATVDFGIVNHGTTSPNRSVTLSNNAMSPLGEVAVDGVSISQTTANWFRFAGTDGCTAGALTCPGLVDMSIGSSNTFDVRCQPPMGATGIQMGMLIFESDTDAGGVEAVMLQCEAGRAEIDVMPASGTLAFGSILVGTATGTMNVTIENDGNAPLTYSIAETDAGDDFEITSGCTSGCTVPAGMSTPVAVRFRPQVTSTGPQSATLTISHNDPSTSSVAVTLTGTGTAPVITKTAPAGTSIDFMSVEMGTSSAPATISINNTGTAPLSITSVAIVGANPGSYSIGGMGMTGMHSIPNGMGSSWTVTCTPGLQGAQPATFRIVSNNNGVANSNFDVTLACNGTRGVLTMTPATHDFGGVPTGNMVTQSFLVRNTGNVNVSNISGALTGGPAAFTITSTFPTTPLAPNATFNIVVQFAPVTPADDGPVTLTVTGRWGSMNTTTSDSSTIQGNGLAAGYDVTPATVDFGSQRFDVLTTRTFCIENTGESDVTLTGMMLTLTGTTMAGELSIVSAKRNCGTAGAAVALPFSNVLITPAQRVEVTVRMDPANRTGAITGTITITSNFQSNPNRTIMLTGISTSGGIATTPGLVVDFGGRDLDAGAVVQDVVITNTGDGPLDLESFARTGSTAFSLTLPPDQTLDPGDMVTISVTYTPAMERPAGQFDELTLSHSIDGIVNGPTSQMITIRGRGIDRHIDVGAAPTFPPTFRNPGSAAPTGDVTVTNTGEAPLVISAVMLSGSAFQLVNPDPVTIPGGGMHVFQVRFVPTMGNMSYDGELVLTNDDDGMPMAMVSLSGMGLDRMVNLVGDPIDLGITGIGVPITLPDGLVVASTDPDNPFTITRIDLDDPSGAFSIVEAPMDESLPPSAMAAYDITFAPTEEGEFEAMAMLYLDEDMEATSAVRIQGRAVFVELSGGGGCSTSRGGAGLPLGLGALAFALRRRRRTASLWALLASATLLVLASPATARAQGAEPNLSLDLSLFDPTPSTTGTTLQVQSATVGRHGAWVLGATMSNATNPLVLSYGGMEHMSISRRTMIELGGAVAFLDRFEAGLRMPLYNQTGDGTALNIDSPSGTAIGDLVAHVKAMAFRTTGAADISGGASVAVTLPTATEQQFAGTDKPTVRALALLTVTPHTMLTFNLNAGGVIRSKSALTNIEQGSGFAFGGGAAVRVIPTLSLFGEIYGEVLPSAEVPEAMRTAETMVTSEWLAGAAFRPDPRVAIVAGAGRGLVAAIGTPDLRAVLSLSITMGNAREESLAPPRPPVVDGDRDSDGIADSADSCDDEMEDVDGFQDDDGCPDTDNDGDGFLDSDDKCRNEAEDRDEFADTDGCPDPDNDDDGVLDAADKCSGELEDKDGVQDDDGCPDLDNDGDGIADAADKCPVEAETINGNADDDGCPDAGDAAVALTPSAIELLEAIEFTGAKLKPSSSHVLGQVAATLRAHPEILRIKINAHVNASRDPDKDKTVTEQRVMEIREWLIKAGVAADRISGSGMGGTKPLVKGKKTPLNERVEIIIIERK